MTPDEARESLRTDGAIDEVDRDLVLDGLKRLVEAASGQGRDWKLVAAAVQTITDFLLEFREQVYEDEDEEKTGSAREHAVERSQPAATRGDGWRRQLSAVLRSRVRAVVDSLSDDETASVMSVGLRQVRRRAQASDLYYFTVGGKRRYPMWQFDWRGKLVPGMRDVTPAIPEDWSPERTLSFMTTFESGLNIHGEPLTPAEWVCIGCDPLQVVELMNGTGRS